MFLRPGAQDISTPQSFPIVVIVHISYLSTLGNLDWIDFLVFSHKVEFGYSFGGKMTPDQLNNV